MFALVVAIVATILRTSEAAATNYTVWSSVVFSRTGERTPEVLGFDLPSTLTSLGAQQQYISGSHFRERYLGPYGSSNGVGPAPIQGVNMNEIDVMQLYVAAYDEQYNIASAQAFLQGLYPPYSLTSNDTGVDRMLDPTSVLANNTYVCIIL